MLSFANNTSRKPFALNFYSHSYFAGASQIALLTEPISSDFDSSNQSNPESTFINAENKLDLYKCMQMLDERSREVVYLRISSDLSFKDIGEILGETENCTRETFFRAKKKLALYLKGRK